MPNEGRQGRAPKSRGQLEAEYGQVWDDDQFAEEFVITAIVGLSVVVRRKADNVVGTMMYQNNPRFYFEFQAKES